MVIGHRGASALAPENTLAAFRRAIADGADGVELDVRLSGDGIPVVIHDANLLRTGLGSGVVAEMQAGELCRTDVGSWFNRRRPRLARDEYSRARLSSLDEVFKLFTTEGDAFKQARLYLEIKTESVKPQVAELTGAIVASVLAQRLEQRVVLIAFDLNAITEAKRISSAVRTGALFQPRLSQPGDLIRRQDLLVRTIDAGADEIALHRSLATRALVASAVDHGLNVVVWTVNQPKWIVRARNWGIHALITDNPAAMLPGTDVS